MTAVQEPHATFQQKDLCLLDAHLADVHHQRKPSAKATLEEQEGTEQAIYCAYWDHVEDDEQKAAKRQDYWPQAQQLALQEPYYLPFYHMDTQMEVEQHIWVYAQANL